VDQGPAQGNLEALAGRKALAAPVGDLAHLEQLEQLVDALLQISTLEPVQSPVITDVLAGGKPGVDAVAVGQCADVGLRCARLPMERWWGPIR